MTHEYNNQYSVHVIFFRSRKGSQASLYNRQESNYELTWCAGHFKFLTFDHSNQLTPEKGNKTTKC